MLIQIHQIDRSGKTIAIINRLADGNVECSGDHAKYEALRQRATRMAMSWANIFPEKKYAVREVTREQDQTWNKVRA